MFVSVMWKIELSDIKEMNETFERLLQKKERLDKNRPLSVSILNKLREGLNIEWTYNSNSIEGNTLTLRETQIVLEEGITVSGKSLREHFEITNHHEAIGFLENLVDKKNELREREILDIHELVMSKIELDFAGRIRNGGVRIMGANFVPPNPLKVQVLLDELVNFVNTNPMDLNPILLATIFHHRFVWIHPFFDGNGRTVRLVMNLILMRFGFPPAIILKNDRKKYYDALNQANNGSYKKLSLLMAQALERSLDLYLSAFPKTYQEYMPIQHLLEEEQLPYGQEYVSLLARQGKIDAYKEGRNWVTSKVALEDYIQNRKRKR